MPRPTLRVSSSFGGNLLFERSVAALGFDDSLMRRLLRDALARVGASPLHATLQEMGMLLPEVERRLLLLAPYERAASAIARLRRMLMCWDAMAEPQALLMRAPRSS